MIKRSQRLRQKEIGFGKMDIQSIVEQIKEDALNEQIPIMSDEGIQYLLEYIEKNSIRNILEIGTAVGYSAIKMCLVHPDIKVVTIERDETRYLEALKNIKKVGLEDRIQLLYHDAFDVSLDEEFDLIFIDAAKAQNKNFFEKFEKNLKDDGTIITDNMSFHGLVNKNLEDIQSRNLRQMVRKIKQYILFLEENPNYRTRFFKLGDGIAVSKHV